MKAAVLNQIGDSKLELRDDVTTTDVDPREVRLRVWATVVAQELFLHDKRILGSFYGGADVRRDYPRLLALWRAGRLDLDSMISRRLELDEINDALDALKGGTNVIRQIVTF